MHLGIKLLFLLVIFRVFGFDISITTCIHSPTHRLAKTQPEYFWKESALRLDNVTVLNLCDGKIWSGSKTKYDLLHSYASQLPNDHIIFFTDSLNTIFNIDSVEDLIRRFHKVRRHSRIVFSSEFECFVNKSCDYFQTSLYGNTLEYSPTKAAFFSPGAFAGFSHAVVSFVENCFTSFNHFHSNKNMAFNDHFALNLVYSQGLLKFAVDYHWILFGSMHIVVAPNEVPLRLTINPSHQLNITCLTQERKVSHDCVHLKIHDLDIWHLDETDCSYSIDDFSLHPALNSSIFHGISSNSAILHMRSLFTSLTFHHYGHRVVQCLSNRRNSQSILATLSS